MTYDNNQTPLRGIATGAIGAFKCVQRDPNADDKLKIATSNVRCLGIGPDYSVADGEAFPYYVSGVAQAECGGTVTRGDRVRSDANGDVEPIATGGTEVQNVVGLANRSGVDGDVIPVQIEIWQEAVGDYLS